jgi:hypothetical protein
MDALKANFPSGKQSRTSQAPFPLAINDSPDNFLSSLSILLFSLVFTSPEIDSGPLMIPSGGENENRN